MTAPKPPRVSRLSFEERRAFFIEGAARARLSEEQADAEALLVRAEDPEALRGLSETMIENAVGFFALPWGLAEGFLIDGELLHIPMATEEPSVVAAASLAAGLIRLGGGLHTQAAESIVTAQVWMERVPQAKYALFLDAESASDSPPRAEDHFPERRMPDAFAPEARALIGAMRARLAALAGEALPNLAARGGGFVSADVRALPELTGILRIHAHLRVCDAMGANMANTFAEAAKPVLEELFGGRALAAILTNESAGRIARARFSVPARALRRGGTGGEEMARRIALFSEIAHHDRARAITANKGIMNGITALAIATGNDSRAVEAAVHAWASAGGRYIPLSKYNFDGESLQGEIALPLPLASVSSTAKLHPGASLSLAFLGQPSAPRLAAIAAALGLAQNFAALLALVGEGIQEGHMRLHERRRQAGD